VLSLGLLAEDADARRLGGGSSLGKQRSTITQPAPKSPAQQAPSAAPATPAQQPSGMSKWLGPLAGLALGAGLASLFMNNGLAGAFGGILMVLLLAAAAMFAWRMLRPKPQAGPLQYAGMGTQGGQPNISNMFGGGAVAPVTASPYPAGFDAEQFARHAKLNFTRLQQANDKRDLSTMRDFMTPELYAEVVADLNARDGAPQQTDVVTLNAEVIEVVTEGAAYIASVRFSGMIRERADGAAEPFSEVWHLEKPITGSTGWLICGIQQD
jgi:predicted lipid-binding transport protein (Tim44 family)